jgi:kynureninase
LVNCVIDSSHCSSRLGASEGSEAMSATCSLPSDSKAYAEAVDEQDPLRHLRSEFIIPSTNDLKRSTLSSSDEKYASPPSTYLCGNSLGLQPRRTKDHVTSFLAAWSSKAVTGHFRNHSDSNLPPFVDVEDHVAELMAPIVGARQDEVAVMGTLTSNLHLLMASFYRPTKERYKIILEGKSFPSDHVGCAAIRYRFQDHGSLRCYGCGTNSLSSANTVVTLTVCCRIAGPTTRT